MTIKIDRLLAHAKKNLKNGEIEKARKSYLSILEDFPNNNEAKKRLLSLDKSAKLPLSQDNLNSIIQLYSSGKIEEAIDSSNAMIEIHPLEPSLFNICGACFMALGKLESAAKSFEKAISINSGYAEAHYNLGFALQGLSKFDEAKNCYENAIAIKHAYPNAHNNLGLVFLKLNELSSALQHFNWAISYNNNFAEAHNNLGATLQKNNQHSSAIKQFEKAIKINSNYSQAFNNLGILQQNLGHQDEAIKNYQKAISTKADYAAAHYNLSNLKEYKANDAQIIQMKSLLSNGELSRSEKIYINFALAKVNDDLGNHKELFEFLKEGNQLRKEEFKYSLDTDIKKHKIFKNIFNSQLSDISGDISDGLLSKKLIFIVGMPRSGTTLVEQILASHKEVYGADELSTMSDLINQNLQDPTSDNSIAINYNSIRSKYLDQINSLDISEDTVTDKWPLNFQYIGFILSIFPDAKIVHLKRDARATCWSIYKHFFSDTGNGWAYNFDDITGFYSLYNELMIFWHELFPDRIYDMSYESLTINQEDETKKLLKYCELEWDKNCLNFHTNTRVVKTASVLQVRKKMYQGSSMAWKKYEENLKHLINSLKAF